MYIFIIIMRMLEQSAIINPNSREETASPRLVHIIVDEYVMYVPAI